jgi:hypothetical protein
MLVDGPQCGHFRRNIFQELRQADIGCVAVTCRFWQDPLESLDSLGVPARPSQCRAV